MLPGHVCQHWTPSLVPRSQSQGCLMSPDSSWPRDARTARGMPGGGSKDMDTSHRCKDLVQGVGDLVEVQPTPWGKSGAKWWIPNQDHGRSGHGPSALQGHDCAAMLYKEMFTMFRMISDQDLAHPAWRWQCRHLHSATRQQRRVSCGTHTNIYVSGELRNRSQSFTTIQRTHNYQDQDHVNAKLE